jgi:ABC-type dipeptide/oligopeptide/nickel transport system permease component
MKGIRHRLVVKENCNMPATTLLLIVIALLVGLIIGIVLGVALASALVRGHYSHIMAASTHAYAPPQPHYQDHVAPPPYR